MPKVVSLVPPSRFQRFGIFFPSDWDVVYAESDSDEYLIPLVGDCDFIFPMSISTVSAKVIEAAKNLKFIHTEGVGFNTIDIEAAAARGIPVSNNRATNNVAVAEHTVGLMLAGLRRTCRIDREVRAGKFLQSQSQHRAEGSQELASRHVGLVGIGAIGKETAKRLMPFGCKVSYFDAFRPTPEVEKQLNVEFLEYDELIKQCDIISFHVPVLPSTYHMLSWDQFKALKPETLIINTARGDIIDQPALVDALETGKIYGAALDTLSPEPPQADVDLLNMSPEAMDKLTITPHIGGTNDEAFTRMLSNAIAQMQNILDGKKPINVVNGVE